MENIYDVIIIGGGPAGLSAGLYAARGKLSTLVLEKEKAGGQIVGTAEIANYPGSMPNASGESLIDRMVDQCKEFGAGFEIDEIKEIKQEGPLKVLVGENATYKAKTLIAAMGASPRTLGVPGEKELTGKGVSYCTTCDADFFTGLEVFVVGGGDAAVEEAIYLTRFARKVSIVHRRDELRAAKSIQEKAFNNPKIEIIWDTTVKEVKGEMVANGIVLENLKTGEVTDHMAEEGVLGIFMYVGYKPATDLFKGILDMDGAGYIVAGEDMKTSADGIFVAGDCRVKTVRQVITAAADGAIAAIQAGKYIENNNL